MAESTKKDVTRATSALAKSSGKAKKGAKTEYTTGSEELVDKVVRRKFIADRSKQIYTQIEAEVIAVAEEIYEERALGGKFQKSVNLAGDVYEGLNVSFSDSFSGIPVESKEEIIESYVSAGMSEKEANKAFEDNFVEGRVVKLEDTSNETISAIDLLLRFGQVLASDMDTEEVVKNIDKLRRDLRGRINRGGQLDFGDIFSSKIELIPTPGMDERQFKQPEDVRGLLKQKKASTKMKVKVATAAAADEAIEDVSKLIRESTEG